MTQPWDHAAWLERFHRASERRDSPALRELRASVFRSTVEALRKRGYEIRAILRIAARHGHTHLVLSAFGCRAFGNPPQHVACLFRETLGEEEFVGVFARIVFAIFDDHNAYAPHNPEGNYVPFKREFAASRRS